MRCNYWFGENTWQFWQCSEESFSCKIQMIGLDNLMPWGRQTFTVVRFKFHKDPKHLFCLARDIQQYRQITNNLFIFDCQSVQRCIHMDSNQIQLTSVWFYSSMCVRTQTEDLWTLIWTKKMHYIVQLYLQETSSEVVLDFQGPARCPDLFVINPSVTAFYIFLQRALHAQSWYFNMTICSSNFGWWEMLSIEGNISAE